jgi:hypothetical protein
MKRKMKKNFAKPMLTSWLVLLLFAAFNFSSCVIIAKYDPIALEKATSLKTLSLQLMDKAVEPYTGHETEVNKLMGKVKEAFEYAANIPRNKNSEKQWQIMWDDGRNLLGGYMKRWKEEGRLGSAFVAEAKRQISQAFGEIIDLENGKKH